MRNFKKFGTAINCIDGRVQNPVSNWVKLNSYVEYVDMITTPGIVKVLSEGSNDQINSIAEKLRVSIKYHQSEIIAVAGHFDCAANNVSFEEQKLQIEEGVDLIDSWNFGIRVVGLYVNEWNSVNLICDTHAKFKEIKSFL